MCWAPLEHSRTVCLFTATFSRSSSKRYIFVSYYLLPLTKKKKGILLRETLHLEDRILSYGADEIGKIPFLKAMLIHLD